MLAHRRTSPSRSRSSTNAPQGAPRVLGAELGRQQTAAAAAALTALALEPGGRHQLAAQGALSLRAAAEAQRPFAADGLPQGGLQGAAPRLPAAPVPPPRQHERVGERHVLEKHGALHLVRGGGPSGDLGPVLFRKGDARRGAVPRLGRLVLEEVLALEGAGRGVPGRGPEEGQALGPRDAELRDHLRHAGLHPGQHLGVREHAGDALALALALLLPRGRGTMAAARGCGGGIRSGEATRLAETAAAETAAAVAETAAITITEAAAAAITETAELAAAKIAITILVAVAEATIAETAYITKTTATHVSAPQNLCVGNSGHQSRFDCR